MKMCTSNNVRSFFSPQGEKGDKGDTGDKGCKGETVSLSSKLHINSCLLYLCIFYVFIIFLCIFKPTVLNSNTLCENSHLRKVNFFFSVCLFVVLCSYKDVTVFPFQSFLRATPVLASFLKEQRETRGTLAQR